MPNYYKEPSHPDCILMVREGLGGDYFITIRTNNGGVTGHRISSPALPPRKTFLEAQADLDAYAAKKKFVKII